MRGLPNIKETYIDFNNGLVQTNYTDLTTFIPTLNNVKGIALNKLNFIQYNGNYTGFINDFVTYGTLQTNLGIIKTDLNMKLPEGQDPNYSGKIETENFKLGSFLNDSKIGDIGFNGKIEGTGFDINKLKASIDGTTSKFEYGNYTYKNITSIGKIENKKYLGKIITNDPNLIANVEGTIDFSKSIPYFDVKTKIEKSNFKQLQFTKDDYSLTGNVDLKFSASNLDNFDGTIKLNGASLTKDGEKLPFDYITIQSTKTATGKEFFVTSNEFEGTVKGTFSFNSVVNSFGFFLNKYYPTIFAAPKKIDRNQNFEFDITTKNVADYIKLLDKKLQGFNESHIVGSINTATNVNRIYANVPFFAYTNKYQFNDLLFNGNGTLDSLFIDGDVGTLTINDSLHFYNTKVNIKTIKNESTFSVNSTGDKTLNALEVNGNIKIFKDGIEAIFNPSSFTVNNKKWVLEKDGEVIVHNKAIAINDLKFVHNNQSIIVKSELDEVENFYNIIADVKDIEIGDITPLFVKTNKFEGKFNGKIKVKDPLGKPSIETENAYINDFVKDDEYIGKVNLSTKFDFATNNVDYTLKSVSPKYRFGVTGYYHPKDSTGTTISNKIVLDCTNIKIIENYLSGVFKDIEGCAIGEIEIFGTEKKQFILGKVDINDSLKMRVKYTDVKYILQKGSIVFNARDIDFSGITIKDTLNNVGKINRGRIRHDGFFQNMDFDIDVTSDKMLLINTTRLNNETFYGSAIADASMKLKGPINNLKMKVLVNNPDDAQLTLNTNAEGKTLGKADFIEFKTYGKEMATVKKAESSNMDIELVLNANKNAKIKVILDEIAGDNISATGNGNIKIDIASSGELKINGLYTVQEGKYDFSLTSLFRKPFVLQKGSTISWNGDPYNAAINLTATYVARKVSLSDLPKSFANTSAIAPIDLQVSAFLTESLTKPKIKFDIDYINTTQKNNPDIDNILDRLRKDENELNKQVGFLVLFDRLLPTSGTGFTSGGTEVVANTLSKFFINKIEGSINNILDKLFPNKNVKINIDLNAYSPGGIGALLNKRISSNFGFQYNFLDNRTTFYFTGNVDFGLAGSQSAVQFSPNFILEYKVRRDGSIIGTLFRKNGFDAIQSTGAERNRRVSNGVGLAYRNEDDDFKNLFRKKRKKKA
jgi:TamB, inner membrane protein subunit of TAM complex